MAVEDSRPPTDAPADTDHTAPGERDDEPGARPPGVVTRTVEVGGAPDEVWQAVADPAERALWLDDVDALARHVRVDEATPGHRLVWTWWRPGDEGDASTVSVVLSPVDGGGTRVVVTESLPATPPVRASVEVSADAGSSWGSVGVSAHTGSTSRSVEVSADAGSTSRSVAGIRRAPASLRAGRDRWSSRLLGLELLFVAARVAVA